MHLRDLRCRRASFKAVDGGDVWMIRAPRRTCASRLKRASAIDVLRDGVGKNLQRDVAPELRVARAIDLAHRRRPRAERISCGPKWGTGVRAKRLPGIIRAGCQRGLDCSWSDGRFTNPASGVFGGRENGLGLLAAPSFLRPSLNGAPGRRGSRDQAESSGLAQRLPANQRAPEREERLVDVGPLVIPHAQAAKLTEPGKCALHDPPPPAQATPVRGATHGQPRARCGESGDRAEWRPRRSRDPRAHSPAAAAVAPSRRAAGESHPPTPGLLASRSGSRRSDAPASGTPRPSQIRWRLLPRLARSVGFGPVWSPPYTARMEQLSTTARDQSIRPWRASYRQCGGEFCVCALFKGVYRQNIRA